MIYYLSTEAELTVTVGGVLVKTLTIAGILLFATGSLSASTIGNTLTNRGNVDSCGGCYFVLNGALTAGDTITGWSIFSNVNPGNLITPFLIDITTDIITAVGTAQTNAASGVQAFSFGLVSGSAVANANTRLGWRDGTTTTANNGSIKFDNVVDSLTAGYWISGPATFGTSTNMGAPTVADSGRYYSVQVVSTAPGGVPEPATWTFAGMGLALVSLKALRNRRSAT